MNVLSTKKISLVVLLVLTALIIVLGPDTTLAQEAGENTKIGGGAWYETILWTFVNSFFGLLVWIAGTLLNISVSQFVVGFGDLFKTQGLGFAVDHLWTLVRDIFNLTFIFGLVYIGFKMILRTDDSNAKRMLVHIILAALLVNFSLFFAKAIVDFSNIAATQVAQGFYEGATGEYAVSDRFMNVLGLSSIWGTNGEFLKNVTTGQGNGIGYIFGTMLIFIITAFVFFAGAMLLLIRFVVLNIYLILSPVMFLGWVFPNLSDASSRYWKSFLNQAFLAPAYLLMLYFSYYILKEFNNLTADKNNYAMIFSGKDPGNTMNIIPYFVITCIFLLASVMVAKKMSSEGASWATNGAMGFAKKLTLGGVGLATYLPRAGTRWTANKAGSMAEKGFNNLQARGGKIGAISSWNAIDRKVRSATTGLKETEFGTGTTNLKESAYKKNTNARINQTIGENSRADSFKESNKILSSNTSSTQDLTKALEDLSKSVKSMSGVEKERLGIDKLKDKHIAVNLTDSDIDGLEKTGNFSAQQIKDIKTARNEGLVNIATTGSTFGANPTNPNASAIDNRESVFAKKSIKDISKLPTEVFQNQSMYAHITPAMLEEKLKEGTPNNNERQAIRKAVSDHLQISVNDRPEAHVLGANNPWVKWANSNSPHAAQFFS